MPYIFAYGGNTNPNQLRKQYLSHRVIGVGILPNSRIAFHSYECKDVCPNTFTKLESTYCDIISHPHTQTQGLVVELSEDDLAKMDRQECLGCIYHRHQHSVKVADGTEVSCWVYQMIYPIDNHALPSERYLTVVRYGYEHFGIDLGQLSSYRP